MVILFLIIKKGLKLHLNLVYIQDYLICNNILIFFGEFLQNQETPKYFVQVKNAILSKWNGQKVVKAVKMKVDGVTGATMSSDAVKENVKRGLEYYQKNK